MTFNIQVVLEHKNDVIRNIEIPSKKTLEDLHYAIIESLKLNKNEMASFYITNKNLDLLNEIPLFKIDEKTNFTMSKIKIETIFECKLIDLFSRPCSISSILEKIPLGFFSLSSACDK